MSRTIRLGFLGLGNIGSATYNLLRDKADRIAERAGAEIRVAKALVRDASRPRPGVDRGILTESVEDILGDPAIDIVVELLGGEEPATSLMARALRSGKAVVTANKLALALHARELFEASREGGARLAFEASVAAGIPIIRSLREGLSANSVAKVEGILNGTTNYILCQMAERGVGYAEVLAEAQRLGYAEPDPSSDVEGRDSAYKISILASLAFGRACSPSEVSCRGITEVDALDIAYARRFGYAIKLVALAERREGGLYLGVQPTLIPADHPMAHVGGPFNSVFLQADVVGDLMFYGPGAGPKATASSLAADIVDLAREPGALDPPELGSGLPLLPAGSRVGRRYLRLLAPDEPGILGKIATVLGAWGVSIQTLTQELCPDGRARVLIFTHEAAESSHEAALGEIARLGAGLETESAMWVDSLGGR
jgi:homoserine dehydrogenase